MRDERAGRGARDWADALERFLSTNGATRRVSVRYAVACLAQVAIARRLRTRRLLRAVNGTWRLSSERNALLEAFLDTNPEGLPETTRWNAGTDTRCGAA